jgi:ribosomal protein L32
MSARSVKKKLNRCPNCGSTRFREDTITACFSYKTEDGETISVHCFRKQATPFLAEFVEILRSPQLWICWNTMCLKLPRCR